MRLVFDARGWKTGEKKLHTEKIATDQKPEIRLKPVGKVRVAINFFAIHLISIKRRTLQFDRWNGRGREGESLSNLA